MRQWALSLGCDEDMTPGAMGTTKVKMLPDGAALFTRGMNASCTWTTERGFGERSWYAWLAAPECVGCWIVREW
eukprot:scaffold1755_cov247-Pinguiococcus_pyrenoidosus.AAC.1